MVSRFLYELLKISKFTLKVFLRDLQSLFSQYVVEHNLCFIKYKFIETIDTHGNRKKTVFFVVVVVFLTYY